MSTIQPGTLFVIDTFAAPGHKQRDREHGDRVVDAAVHEGFNRQNIVKVAKTDQVVNNREVFQPNMAPDAFKKALRNDMVQMQVGTLNQGSDSLNNLQAQGAQNSVANLSLGMSKASLVDQYNQKMMLALDGLEENAPGKTDAERKQSLADATAFFDNYAKAAGTTPNQLREDLSGTNFKQAEQKVKDNLGKFADSAANDSRVNDAKVKYAQAVTGFEKNHNSVVVAAENSGDLRLTKQSKDFYDNVLSNDQTTTVGAVNASNQQVETYSNPSSNVEVYARGQTVNFHKDGTSYATPRVAAAMARAHAMNQRMESEEVERTVINNYTSTVPGTNKHALNQSKLQGVF